MGREPIRTTKRHYNRRVLEPVKLSYSEVLTYTGRIPIGGTKGERA